MNQTKQLRGESQQYQLWSEAKQWMKSQKEKAYSLKGIVHPEILFTPSSSSTVWHSARMNLKRTFGYGHKTWGAWICFFSFSNSKTLFLKVCRAQNERYTTTGIVLYVLYVYIFVCPSLLKSNYFSFYIKCKMSLLSKHDFFSSFLIFLA